jgi:Tfp pilus assembly protein PilV
MRKQFLVAVGCLISSIAAAQEWRPVAEKWRACADAAAARYAKSTESAPVVARLASLSCVAERKATLEAVKNVESASFSEDYVDTLERHYLDILSVKVIEMRLR